jgi:ATP-dependent Lon protease
LVSLISGRKVKPNVGMTGEITLRGQVLPIGGLKEKVLAAHRNGLRTIILPKRNEQDLDDVPDEIKKSMKFIYAETMDDVLESALEANHKRRATRNGSVDKSTRSKPAAKKKSTSRKTRTNGKDTTRRR